MSFSRRVLRAVARGAVYPGVMYATLLVLWVRARVVLRGRTPRRLIFTGHDRVLVVAAHPDDETIGCAAAIASHRSAGDAVEVLLITDGRGSRAGGLAPDEMARKRREEVASVAPHFPGAEFKQLSLPESEWDPFELK